MGWDILIVGFGGFLGSICRFLVYIFFNSKNLNSFPWATLFINVLGCLVIGVIVGFVDRQITYHKQLYLMGAVGFLGAFTTFSSFGWETLQLLKNQQFLLALANISGNVLIGLGAVWTGLLIAD